MIYLFLFKFILIFLINNNNYFSILCITSTFECMRNNCWIKKYQNVRILINILYPLRIYTLNYRLLFENRILVYLNNNGREVKFFKLWKNIELNVKNMPENNCTKIIYTCRKIARLMIKKSLCRYKYIICRYLPVLSYILK